MRTIIVTGGTGLIGSAISGALVAKGDHVIILTRDPGSPPKKSGAATGSVEFAKWDPAKKKIDPSAIARADYIIHLAGAGIADKRWTRKRKQEIIESRVQGSQLICQTLINTPNKVKAIISASAIGWYGPDQEVGRGFVETDPAYHDFLGNTCRLWEESIQPVTENKKRLVILRTGIVLSEKGGALSEFIKALKFGAAPILGSGKQIISWIHIDDLVRLYIHALDDEKMQGVYNAVSGNPVTNKELVLTLAKARDKFFIPAKAPSFMLKMILGEMSIEVLKSATVNNQKLVESGFRFVHDDIREAMKDLVSP